MSELKIHTFSAFQLEDGTSLEDVDVAYRTWGALNTRGDNVIVVCHSLTGDSDALEWWPLLFGARHVLDPNSHFIICVNLLGSCYGTTGPCSINTRTGVPFGGSFPVPTIRDNAILQQRLLAELGVKGIEMVIGGSLGGMIALEWALLDPALKRVVTVASSARHSAWCIGWSEAQRQAIYADPHWNDGNYSAASPPSGGLAAARMIAMLSYRNARSFQDRFAREYSSPQESFAVETYLRYQGQKLKGRFDANCYVTLSKSSNTHDIARGRGEFEDVLGQIAQDVLIVGVDTDILFPMAEQEELASLIPSANLAILRSSHGHDAFLLEGERLNQLIINWCRNLSTKGRPGIRGLDVTHSFANQSQSCTSK